MSIQDDGATLKIDHGQNLIPQTSFGGRGSYPPPRAKPPTIKPMQNVPGSMAMSLQGEASSPQVVSRTPIQQRSEQTAVEAIYASGDQAKIAAWEKFVALKEQGDQALANIKDRTGISSGASLQVDHGAARITDKTMLVDTDVHTHQSNPLGSQDTGSFGSKQ